MAYPAYGTPQSERTELDHLVPLELGGSNDATNLWPEYPPSPNPKDKVEDALNAAVCEAGQPHRSAGRHRVGLAHRREEARNQRSLVQASASYDAGYGDYDIYVHSNQPDRTVTASASNGASHSYRTDSSGYADVYLYAAAGDTVKVTVGSASCSTTA